MTTAGILPLRDYQRSALDALREKWKTDGNRLAVILPTGGGKTVCFAHLSKEYLDEHPGHRVIILVHTDELVKQAAGKVRAVAPHLSVGIVQASRNEVRADVIVASVQSLRNARRRDQIRHVGLIIVDECHHATARTYRAILEHYGAMGAATLTAGFTATLARGDGGPLGDIWQGVAFVRDIGWMVRKEYLIPPRGRAVRVPDFDLSAVRQTRKDYREGELGDALASSLAPELVAAAYVEHAADRRGIMFCPTVASAYVMADAMVAAGVSCEVVHGALDPLERAAVLARHRSGLTQVVANCMVLTEGYDDPAVSCIVVARPTQSKPLYIQMVGRGLRVDPDQPYVGQDCLILDVVGASEKHDLRSVADLTDKPVRKPRDGETLLDLEDELDAGEGVEPDPEHHYMGPVEVRAFDPLAAKSSRVWITTAGGHRFVPAGKQAYAFLVPSDDPDAWFVAWCTKDSRPWTCPSRMHGPDCLQWHGKRGGCVDDEPEPLADAMVRAEDLAVDLGMDLAETLTKKAAAWRRRYPSESATQMAVSLGITVTERMKAGELSDRITKVVASRRIDPVVRALIQQRQSREKVAA